VERRTLVHDARSLGWGWRVWFWVLLIVNILGPVVFVTRLEAALTLAAYLVASVIIVMMHRRLGWVRILGLGHVLWLALLPWLIHRYLTTDPGGLFGAWMLSVIVVDIVCLLMDLGDIVRYLRGDRAPVVPR